MAGFSLLTQLSAAALVVKDPRSPNAATTLAYRLVAGEGYTIAAWHRLVGTNPAPVEPLRAWHLPGEPLYQAAGFACLPVRMHRYLHVPVTVLYVTMVAVVGVRVGGRAVGLLAGGLAAADPFTLIHGPVWDDVMLAAALEWTVLASLTTRQATCRPGGWVGAFGVLIAAAAAAITRSQSQVVLGALGLAAGILPALRPARRQGLAVLVGVAVGMAAWGGRNAVVIGTPLTGSTHDGITLFESNYRHARAAVFETGTAEGFSQSHLDDQFGAAAGLGEVDVDRYYRRQAVAYAADHPLDVCRTALLKLVVSLSGYDFARPPGSARNLVALATAPPLLAAGVVGLVRLGRRQERPLRQWFLVMAGVLCVTTLLLLAVGPVGLRYRASACGLLYLGAAAVVVRPGSGRS